jgi:nitrate/nitrite transporter NarK
VAVARIGASAYHPVGIAWISREFRGAGVDRAMGIQGGLGDAGVLLGLLLAGTLVSLGGWQGTFLFWGVLNVAAAVSGFVLTAKSRDAATPGRSGVAPRDILRRVAPWIFPLAAGGSVFTITTNFGPLFLVDRFGLSAGASTSLVAAWLGAGVVAGLGFGRISRRFGRGNVLRFAFLGVAVGGVMIASARDLLTVALGLVAFNGLLFLTYPALFSFLSDVADVRAQGASFGAVFGFQLIGGALAAYAGGILAATSRNPAMPFLLLAAIALGAFAYLHVPRSTRPANAT